MPVLYERKMHRCMRCDTWWSLGPHDRPICACGGSLYEVDMDEYLKTVPTAKPPQPK